MGEQVDTYMRKVHAFINNRNIPTKELEKELKYKENEKGKWSIILWKICPKSYKQEKK